MVDSAALYAYILANVGFVVIGGLLATLSYRSYCHHPGQRSYAIAALGFVCVLLGGLFETTYVFYSGSDFLFSNAEYLSLQIVEDVLLATGLGLLFYGITQHDADASTDEYVSMADEEDFGLSRHPDDD